MIEAIVLAAGLATRMGKSKPLLVVEGETFLARILRRIGESGITDPIVVLGAPSAQKVCTTVDLSEARAIVNNDPAAGMARSLRLGLENVREAASGALIFHADMPFIKSETVRAVLGAAERGAQLAAPAHRAKRGFPVFFHRACFEALLHSLSGDIGARTYLEAHPTDLQLIAVDDPGCIYDVDRPEDLISWEGECACTTAASTTNLS